MGRAQEELYNGFLALSVRQPPGQGLSPVAEENSEVHRDSGASALGLGVRGVLPRGLRVRGSLSPLGVRGAWVEHPGVP